MGAPDLVALLNASFLLWGVDARAEGDGDHELAAEIRARGAAPMTLSRQTAGRRGLPGWRLELGAGEGVELASLPAVLRRLRLVLDPDHAPRRAIVGLRPPEPVSEDSRR